MQLPHLLVYITAFIGLASAVPSPQRKYSRISDLSDPAVQAELARATFCCDGTVITSACKERGINTLCGLRGAVPEIAFQTPRGSTKVVRRSEGNESDESDEAKEADVASSILNSRRIDWPHSSNMPQPTGNPQYPGFPPGWEPPTVSTSACLWGKQECWYINAEITCCSGSCLRQANGDSVCLPRVMAPRYRLGEISD
ncbi:hypothetical protein FPQ18DRAFT_388038 [Pyronema domesticum]|uniref:Uncharacterized protein n=1 Tax=Pyronema omphalodes (strain CBS 100304) TaxID=1076935 RepID=U4L249_PYROM|nr:hypothetical protein FPQ18DRAFT_388038 [Pyronema domesticum]CCX06343.1 Protein of unknown function [Pyronema omphalodes CBS 100304]